MGGGGCLRCILWRRDRGHSGTIVGAGGSPEHGGQGAPVDQTWWGKRQNGEGITRALPLGSKRPGGLRVWLMVVGRLLRARVMVAARCGGRSARRRRWEALQRRPRSLPSLNCGERRWIGGARRWLGFGSCISKFKEDRPLFVGILVWTRRGLGVLQFLSINRTLIQLRLEDFWKGNELRLVTIRKPNFRKG
jgi:hypothetical protein